jgi:hypothetical protein
MQIGEKGGQVDPPLRMNGAGAGEKLGHIAHDLAHALSRYVLKFGFHDLHISLLQALQASRICRAERRLLFLSLLYAKGGRKSRGRRISGKQRKKERKPFFCKKRIDKMHELYYNNCIIILEGQRSGRFMQESLHFWTQKLAKRAHSQEE